MQSAKQSRRDGELEFCCGNEQNLVPLRFYPESESTLLKIAFVYVY